MATFSIRLPDELERNLDEEARRVDRKRAEVVREAITEYLARKERERFMAEMVEEINRAYADPEIRREALEIAEETVDDGLDDIIAEERAAGIDPDEKWWR